VRTPDVEVKYVPEQILLRRFQSTSRANPLAQKILKAVIEQGLNSSISNYAPDNCKLSLSTVSRSMNSFAGQFVNDTDMPDNFDYNDPSLPFVINGRKEPTSQRFKVWLGYFYHTIGSRGS
jgi:hypothetical protein